MARERYVLAWIAAAFIFLAGVIAGSILASGCTATGACVSHPHFSLCDPQDMDPKCLLDRCDSNDGHVDGGSR